MTALFLLVNPCNHFSRYVETKQGKNMKWLTLEEIKQQLRIEPDFTDEDALLVRYGNSAEAVVLNLTGRTYDELKAMNPTGEDEFPADLWEATILLIEVSYKYRSPISEQNLSKVPYAFDMKIKPYMRLTKKEEDVA